MTVTFELYDQTFMAINGGQYYIFNPTISFLVNCKTQEEVDELWENLFHSGEVE
jgi:predicted 3-demethylubiquinone-9 3-methyltransferase (glyoxalase superfamily)